MALINPAKENAEVVVAAVAARDVPRARGLRRQARHRPGARRLRGADRRPRPRRRSTTRCRTACTASGPAPHSPPASTCCAKSRSPPTPTRPARSPNWPPKSDRVVMEAFHYRYHPLTLRVEEIIASGELGKLQRVEAALCFPLPQVLRHPLQLRARRRRARWTPAATPCTWSAPSAVTTPEVVSAQAKLRDPQVDRAMTAELRFPSGHTGRIRCSMWSSRLLQISARVVGERGRAARPQSGDAAVLSSALGPIAGGQARRAFRAPRLLRVSARRFRRRGAARRTGARPRPTTRSTT